MKVPVLQNRVISPGGSFQAIDLAGAQYQAVNEVAGVLQKRNELARQQKEHTDEIRIRSDMILWGTQYQNELAKNPDNYATWQQSYKSEYKKTLEGKIKDMSPQFQQRIRDWAMLDNTRGQVLVSDKANTVQLANSQATLTTSLNNLSQHAIANPGEMGASLEEAHRAIDEQQRLGNLTSLQAEKAKSEFSSVLHDGIIDKNIHEFDPWSELDKLKKRGYENLTEEKRTYWMKVAQREIDGRLERIRKESDKQAGYALIERHLKAGIGLASTKETRKAADSWYVDRFLPSIIPPQLQGLYKTEPVSLSALPPDLVINAVSNVVSTLGFAPPAMQADLRAGLVGPNMEQRYNAARVIAEIHDKNPYAYTNIPQDQIDTAYMINDARKSGADPRKSLEWVNQIMEVPESTKQTRKNIYREEKYTDHNPKELKSLDWVNGTIPDSLTTEYENAVKSHYTRTGNIDQSRKLAGLQIQRHWGYSDLAGKMMQYPPEKVFSSHERDTRWLDTRFKEATSTLIANMPKATRDYYESILNRPLAADDFKIASDATVGKAIGQIGYPIIAPDGSWLQNEHGIPLRWIPQYKGTQQYFKSMQDKKILEQQKKTEVAFGAMERSMEIDPYSTVSIYDTAKEKAYRLEQEKLWNLKQAEMNTFTPDAGAMP